MQNKDFLKLSVVVVINQKRTGYVADLCAGNAITAVEVDDQTLNHPADMNSLILLEFSSVVVIIIIVTVVS